MVMTTWSERALSQRMTCTFQPGEMVANQRNDAVASGSLDARKGRRAEVALGLILALALALRVFAVHRANTWLPNSVHRLSGDEPGYDEFARLLQGGHWSQYPVRGPGYPALLALLRTATGGNYDLILYLQVLVSTATVALTFLLGRRLFGVTAGLIAAFGTAVYWPLVLEPARLHSELLYTPLLLLFLLCIQSALQRTDWKGYAASGALLGAMNLTRPTTLALPLLLALVVVATSVPRARAAKAGLALVATSCLVVAPATVANAFRYQAFLPVSTTTGVLWQGSPEYYDLQQSGRTYSSIWENELNPQRNGGRWVGTIEGDRYFTERAIRSIRDRPSTYLSYSLRKVGYFWVGHPSADWANDDILDPRSLTPYYANWEVALMMLSRIVPLAATVALIALLRHRSRWRTLWPILAVLGYFTVVHALTWAELRLSQPLAPLLWVLIGGALSSSWPNDEPESARAAVLDGDPSPPAH